MKLISCHIENFGKLQDCSMEFQNDLNVICEKNGWGKSTFAAFIRAMFYGLEGERKRSIEENERKRYKSWQGGVFGGQLVFEEHGRRYEISRIFQDKEANDEFELRDADTNLISDDYSDKIGEELFQVGRESFLRTVFIGQSACETYATDDISAKIGNITDNTNDLNHYENANARLTELMNRLTPSRKTGSLARRKEEIAQLERLVQDGQEINVSLEQYQKLLQEKEQQYVSEQVQLQQMTTLQKKVAAMQSVLARKEEWEHLKKAVQEKEQTVTKLQGQFPGEIPTTEDMRQAFLLCGEEEKIRDRLEMTRLSENEKRELETFDDSFQNGIPDEKELEEQIRNAADYQKMQQKYTQGKLSEPEQQRYEQLDQVFQNEEEPVSVIIGKWNERNNRKAALPSKQATIAAVKTSVTAKPEKNPAVIGAGIVVLICAVILCVRALWIPGVIALLIGVACIGFGSKGTKKEKATGQEATIQALEEEIVKDTEWIEQIDTEVQNYLTIHGKSFDEYMVSTFLQQIMEESVEYHALQKKAGQVENETDAKERMTLEQNLADFLQRYQMNVTGISYVEALYALQTKCMRYRTLAQQENRKKAAQEEQITVREGLVQLLGKYGYLPEQDVRVQLNALQEVLQQYRRAYENWQESVHTLAEFEKTTDMNLLQQDERIEEMPSLEELNDSVAGLTQSMQVLHKTITEYQKTLEQLGNQYDEWDENRTQLEKLKEVQCEEQKKFQYLKKTQTKLSQAKESLTSRYTAPLLAAFEQYYTSITMQAETDFHLDANIMMTVMEQGKQRDVNTLSKGFQDLIGICLRFAFVDAMYQQESPMLILDDPFTNLDDDKVIAARTLLHEVAKKYQIIYFTCSDARSM